MMGTGLGISDKRVRMSTGSLNSMIGQSLSSATLRSSRSGLTATGWPTFSSNGKSVWLSE